ncbi:MAG: hypothetical protein KDB24_00510 [Microthrixaceae bacterium]|nr:hypothetical protein [Microthrixaceae bacterium]
MNSIDPPPTPRGATMISLWGPKGGQGVSTTVAALAPAQLRRHDCSNVAIVDLTGDQPLLLGVPAQHGVGVLDWLSSDAPASALHRTMLPVRDSIGVVPLGGRDVTGSWTVEREAGLWRAVRSLADVVLVDAGVPAPRVGGGPVERLRRSAVEASTTNVVVTRACYLALRRFRGLGLTCDASVFVQEAQRALARSDVAETLGAEVIATVDVDPAVARAVDSGMLGARPPRRLDRAMTALASGLAASGGEPVAAVSTWTSNGRS